MTKKYICLILKMLIIFPLNRSVEKIDKFFDKATVLNIFVDNNFEKVFNYEFKNIKNICLPI